MCVGLCAEDQTEQPPSKGIDLTGLLGGHKRRLRVLGTEVPQWGPGVELQVLGEKVPQKLKLFL